MGKGVDPYVPGRGDARYEVEHYDLQLDYKVATNHLTGTATLTLRAGEDLEEFALDLEGLHVSKVLLDGKRPARHVHRGTRLVVRPARRLKRGTRVRLRVVYAGKPRPSAGPHGRAGWEELSDGSLVASQPDGAPTFFPCNDRVDAKATYRFAISAKAGYRVVANGRLVERSTRSGRVTWVYEERRPMATYLACIHIGRYVTTPQGACGRVPIELVHPGGARIGSSSAFARQPEMMRLFVRLFGPYPFDTYRAVVTEDPLEIPLEAQGMSSFGINHLTGTAENERLVAHELAHQWFGNSVTVSRWRDIWLHEGFACYGEWLWSEASGRRSAELLARQAWARLRDLPQDLAVADPGAAAMFDDRIYKRGALAVHALRRRVGDEAFFRILRSWTVRHAYRNVTTAQFVAHAEGFTSRPLAGLVADWVAKERLPAL